MIHISLLLNWYLEMSVLYSVTLYLHAEFTDGQQLLLQAGLNLRGMDTKLGTPDNRTEEKNIMLSLYNLGFTEYCKDFH